MEYLKVFDTAANQTAFRMGENYEEPHVSCLTNGSNIKYNRNYIENLWVENENTNPLPDKALILDRPLYWYDITNDSIDTTDAPQYVASAYGLDSSVSGWRLVDASKLNENIVDNAVLEWVFLLWKITDSNVTVTNSDPAVIYVGYPGSGDPRWDGTSYWATSDLILKIGNDYYRTWVYTPD